MTLPTGELPMLSSLLLSAALALGQGPTCGPASIGGAYVPPVPGSANTTTRVGFGTPVSADPIAIGANNPPVVKSSAVIQATAPPKGPLQKAYPTTGITVVQAGKDAPEKGANGAAEEPKNSKKEQSYTPGFLRNFLNAYKDEFFPKKNGAAEEDSPPPPRRALPAPFSSPPFPGSEYQGYPLIGVPYSTTDYPFMKGVYATSWGDAIKATRIKFDGWVTAEGNWSTAKNSNTPDSYWIVPNAFNLDQLVFRLQREMDTVQTYHIDWGFRALVMYGMDYRYMTAGGWFSAQLLKNNLLYGWDPTEVYLEAYIPWIGEGASVRVGRWIACPDIETQWAPDNYMGTHSLLFTVDTYTQTGIMYSQRINEQWMVQAALHAGTDMAPWYPGAIPTGAFGARWVSKDNNDAVYAWLNAINNAKFRHFQEYGQPLGHDNFNYFVATWQHRFTKEILTKTEAYYMWERDAEVGGTPSAGPLKSFGGGGGDGTLIPGYTQSYGIVNYTLFGLTDKDYFTVRNEWYKDESGYRLGARGNYTSHTIGISHYFNNVFIVRPEIGYYRDWTGPSFDLGTKRGIWQYGLDVTIRF
jgi:hypothetical protein